MAVVMVVVVAVVVILAVVVVAAAVVVVGFGYIIQKLTTYYLAFSSYVPVILLCKYVT